LDVEGNSRTAGARVILWNAKGSDNQKWRFENGFIVSVSSGLVLDVKGGDMREGADVIVWNRKSGLSASNQHWKITRRGFIKLAQTRANRSLVLDVKGEDRNPGASLIVWHRK